MILFIDTSDFNGLRLGLINPKAKALTAESVHQVAYNENYKTAKFLQKFLQRNKTQPVHLTKIIVCSGPGSFTGIRVGVALAQALGFALNIPVVAIKKDQVPQDLVRLVSFRGGKHLLLNYGHKPSITKSKKTLIPTPPTGNAR
jgi:tRNA A37 threonylcarbamoyladenosine modification protein TsaB